MIVRACVRLKVILAAAAGVLLVLSPQSSLSEEPNLALGPLPNMPIPAYNLQTDEKVERGPRIQEAVQGGLWDRGVRRRDRAGHRRVRAHRGVDQFGL